MGVSGIGHRRRHDRRQLVTCCIGLSRIFCSAPTLLLFQVLDLGRLGSKRRHGHLGILPTLHMGRAYPCATSCLPRVCAVCHLGQPTDTPLPFLPLCWCVASPDQTRRACICSMDINLGNQSAAGMSHVCRARGLRIRVCELVHATSNLVTFEE